MRILIVGGTRFVGRAITEVASARGHEVTVLHRGQSNDLDLQGVKQILTDRDGDLSALSQLDFDATIDVSAYVPRQVTALAAALDGRGGHHLFVSTMSVYADIDHPGLTEDADLVTLQDSTTEEVSEETYGGLKVLCEGAAAKSYGDRLTVIRPTYVVGPHDYTGRFTWWVRRIARGGDVLLPGPVDAPIQVIDARDQAEWAVDLVESSTAGYFNSVSPSPPFGFGDLMDAVTRAVAPSGTRLVWVDAEWLLARNENAQSLPLWTEGKPEYTLAADPAKALAGGLSPRPLAQTVSDTWEWVQEDQPPLAPGWGLSSAREDELLAEWARS